VQANSEVCIVTSGVEQSPTRSRAEQHGADPVTIDCSPLPSVLQPSDSAVVKGGEGPGCGEQTSGEACTVMSCVERASARRLVLVTRPDGLSNQATSEFKAALGAVAKVHSMMPFQRPSKHLSFKGVPAWQLFNNTFAAPVAAPPRAKGWSLPCAAKRPENGHVIMEGKACLENDIWHLSGEWRYVSTRSSPPPRYDFSWWQKGLGSAGLAHATIDAPRNGQYMGWFTCESRKEDESELHLKFDPNADEGYNVSGSGTNSCGIFKVHGVVDREKNVTMTKVFEIHPKDRTVAPRVSLRSREGKAAKKSERPILRVNHSV